MRDQGALAATGGGYAIATPHALATEAGQSALRDGGNAIDGALAAAAMLTVVYPHMCAVGGDLFALVAHPDQTVTAVNGSGAAGAAADPDRLREARATMPVTGPDTITVPGAVRAWETIAELGGRMELKRLLAPAIACAHEGVAVAPSLARAIGVFADDLACDPGMEALFVDGGALLTEGVPLRQPALARSLEALAADGADALYRGRVGKDLIEGLKRRGSLLDLEDLAGHETELVRPLSCDYQGAEVLTTPPNSQGFVLLEILLALARLEGVPDPLGRDAPLLAEIFRLATEDRDEHLCDPRHAAVPLRELLSNAHATKLIHEARSRLEQPPRPLPVGPQPTGDTVAIVAADGDGRAVSIIQSIFHTFGSGILEPTTGIVCHSRGSFFSLDPSSPNVLAPGKRPSHTLMPVLVRRDDRLVAVHGTMGGRAQPQLHAQLLLRLLGGCPTPARALKAPRWTVGGLDAGTPDDIVLLERSAGDKTAERFRAAGMQVDLLGDLDEGVGHGQLIWCRPDGALEAATDPRSDGAAAAGDP